MQKLIDEKFGELSLIGQELIIIFLSFLKSLLEYNEYDRVFAELEQLSFEEDLESLDFE